MGKIPQKADPRSPRLPPDWADSAAKSENPPVSKNEYAALASVLEGRDSAERVLKKDPHGETLRKTGVLFGNREYVAAYEAFKPVYDKVVADMQRILARNLAVEANRLASKQRTRLAVAKAKVEGIRAIAQQISDQFDRLLRDLEAKPLVRLHLKKGRGGVVADAPPAEESSPTTLDSPSETRLGTDPSPPFEPLEIVSGDQHYRTAPFVPPEKGTLYSVRDKARGQRIIRVTEIDPEGRVVQVETLERGKTSHRPVHVSIESLARQAAKGWCSVLVPVTSDDDASAPASGTASSPTTANTAMRLDIQNFSRCCADIARANIRFSTQLVKDVGDGAFRAGDYEHAFVMFEQISIGFNSAVAGSRREIADGRRTLTAEKGKLSGKEIQDRTAAFTRREQLIHTAEREFSTILEGLRMYLRAEQASANDPPDAPSDLSPQTG